MPLIPAAIITSLRHAPEERHAHKLRLWRSRHFVHQITSMADVTTLQGSFTLPINYFFWERQQYRNPDSVMRKKNLKTSLSTTWRRRWGVQWSHSFSTSELDWGEWLKALPNRICLQGLRKITQTISIAGFLLRFEPETLCICLEVSVEKLSNETCKNNLHNVDYTKR
jgi:hypothetical protein